jgi:hypothetical protein
MGAKNTFAADTPAKPEPIPAATPVPVAPDATQMPAPQAPEVQSESMVQADECADLCDLTVFSPPGRVWLRADYLMWFTSGMDLPPLVTTGPLGSQGVETLYGDRIVNNDGRSGYRTTIGTWLGACRVWGVEFDYLNLGERAGNYDRASTGSPILARPYFNVQTGQQDFSPVAYPNAYTGAISIEAKDYFQSGGALLSYNLCSSNSCGDACDSCGEMCGGGCGMPLLYGCRTDLLVGFRYYNLRDRIHIRDNGTNLRTGETWSSYDDFGADNDFYGSDLGLRTRMHRGRWSLEILTKIAMGNNHRTVRIDGQTTVAGTTVNQYPIGTLALPNPPANIGTYQSDSVTLIPQLGLEIGFQLNCHWRSYLGYNLLYWGSVARAADQIDMNVDPRNQSLQPSGLPFPSYTNRTTGFWAQGVNLGLERRF